MVTIQFVPYTEIEGLTGLSRIRKLLNIAKTNKIVLLQGRLRKEKLEAARKVLPTELPTEQKKQIEQDVLNLVGYKEDTPVVLDFESVRVIEPGKYELDLVQLFKGAPLIFKLEEGKYVIDIVESFERLRKPKK